METDSPDTATETFSVCGLGADGSVSCGDGSDTAPPGSFASIVGGRTFLSGLRSDGTVRDDFPGVVPLPGSYTQLTDNAKCGLRLDGTIVCESFNGGSFITTPGPFSGLLTQTSSLAACGVLADMRLSCFVKDPAAQQSTNVDGPAQAAGWQRLPAN